jgi:hypothetical protein
LLEEVGELMSTHRHHRKRRSQGGDDSYGNIIELPPEIHEWVHREPEIAYKHGLLVHSHDNPSDIRWDVAGFMQALGLESQAPQTEKQTSPEGKPKRPRIKDLAKRKTVSVRLPEGVDGALWNDLLEEARDVELAQPDTQFDSALGAITTGKLLIAVLERFTGRV